MVFFCNQKSARNRYKKEFSLFYFFLCKIMSEGNKRRKSQIERRSLYDSPNSNLIFFEVLYSPAARANAIHKGERKMNKHLIDANFDMGKVEAVMYAIERSYLDFYVPLESRDHAEKAVNAFYVLWDEIHKLADDLEKLTDDSTVIDVINSVRENS